MSENHFLKYFKFNKFLLNVCGVLQVESFGYISNVISIVVPYCCVGFLVLPFFYTFLFHDLDFETAMDIFCLLLEVMAGAFKASLLLRKRKGLTKLVYLCNNLWERVKDEEEAEVARHYAIRGTYFTYGFFLNILAALLNVLVQPVFAKFIFDSNGTMISSKTLPFPSGLFHENVQVFNTWYLMQILPGVMVVILIVGIDTSVLVFVLHACTHFNILQHRLLKFKQSFENNQKELKPKENFENIVTIVNFHQDILQYSEVLEDVYSPVVLLQTVLSITAICIFGINCMIKDEDILNQVLHVVGATVQLLMFCWPPNSLQTESFNVGISTYDLPWYDWSKEEKKLAEIMIFRSQKFAALSAGKFTLMSLRTFSSILSSAYSFFTFLRRIL